MSCSKDLLDPNELGVTCAIEGAVCVVHAAANDGGGRSVHEDAANRCFVVGEGVFSLVGLVSPADLLW